MENKSLSKFRGILFGCEACKQMRMMTDNSQWSLICSYPGATANLFFLLEHSLGKLELQSCLDKEPSSTNPTCSANTSGTQ